MAAARIARDVADSYSADGRTRYVAGSIGPGTKLPSLGHIGFADLRDAYTEQARGLLEGGVDLFVVETCMDLLQVKAAMIACRRAMQAEGRNRPDAGAGHDGDDRPDARRQRDRRRTGVRRGDAPRRARDQLRHRTGRDAGAPPLPQPALATADQRAAERRPAEHRRRADALRPDAGAAGRVPRPAMSPSSACPSSAAAAAPRPSTSATSSTPCATCGRPAARRDREPSVSSIYSPVHDRAGPLVPDHRRAHQRQRLQGVPRRDARRRLGHVHEDGQRAGPRGRPRARRLRRLRRPRRRRRHGRDRQAVRHAVQRAARARLHRDAGVGGRPPAHRRPRRSSTRPTSRTASCRTAGSTA